MEWSYSNYKLESHNVTTEDGYILTLTRLIDMDEIKNKEKESIISKSLSEDSETRNKIFSAQTKKPAVLLVHGLLASSDQWFEGEASKTLPISLKKQGYDCWHANLRGSRQSQSHVEFKNGSKKFWDFTFHEMGYHDLPSMINYILETTGNENLFYIGHSMGCAVFFTMAVLKPEYCSKVKAMAALAPAAYFQHLRSRFLKMSLLCMVPLTKVKWLRGFPLFPKTGLEYSKKICPPCFNSEKIAVKIGLKGAVLVGVICKKEVDKEQAKQLITRYPATTSMKLLQHGIQCKQSENLQYFDYGNSKNLKLYGQNYPPLYDLSKVKVPIIMFHSEGDMLVNPEDGKRLASELPNIVGDHYISSDKFSHASFILSPDSVKIVHEPIIEIFKRYL